MKKAAFFLCLLGVTASLISGCTSAPEQAPETSVLNAEQKGATEITAQMNAGVYDTLDFDDQQELEFASRGLICASESLELKN